MCRWRSGRRDVDETPHPGESPRAYVARIADTKALTVTRPPGRWVLAADTTVTIDGAILGKAETPDEAVAMLRALAGRVHEVVTGFAIVGDGVHHRGVVATDVEMSAFDDATMTTSRAASGAARPARTRSRGSARASCVPCAAR